MTTIITSPFNPTPELQSAEGLQSYLSKLTELSRSDLCIELCSVMAAKYNIKMMPGGLIEKQEIMTDLTDKATSICMLEFGQATVFGFAGSNLSQLNELINIINEKVAQHELEPELHGSMILRELSEILRPESNEESTLSDFVDKTTESEYIFIKINNDLAHAVERISYEDWPPLLLMAYAYARRVATAALYFQGHFDKDVYDQVKVIFQRFQRSTGQTVDFQEEAYAESIRFMAEYSPVITSIVSKKLCEIAEEYEMQPGYVSDEILFKHVIDTIYHEQKMS
ncbi:hypothetical protein FCV82_02070 [Vibrio breoganii]|uniref:hypothetical protein n=1 Tax=Vibrio breoganii TaxID=553239 RepID=UPI000C849ECF|nr:hypothetical protein [Vibrio breoganii]PMN67080.1 hypothetical protein BCT28_03755 [Vibrio breoganii]PMO82943.1 hypothetical protein BCT00_06845 [Vibrio breoganii]TKF90379.1 hypothetical protein FCV82_02070 [Vibrio breoganii]